MAAGSVMVARQGRSEEYFRGCSNSSPPPSAPKVLSMSYTAPGLPTGDGAFPHGQMFSKAVQLVWEGGGRRGRRKLPLTWKTQWAVDSD